MTQSKSKTKRTSYSKTARKTVSKTARKTSSKTARKTLSKTSHKIEKIIIPEAPSVNDRIREIRLELEANRAEQQRLMSELNELMVISESDKTRPTSTQFSSFNVEEPVPKVLAKLLNIDEETMSKCDVTRCFYEYLVDNDLVNKKTREIKLNRKIMRAFDMSDNDVMTFFNIQQWIRKVYEKN